MFIFGFSFAKNERGEALSLSLFIPTLYYFHCATFSIGNLTEWRPSSAAFPMEISITGT